LTRVFIFVPLHLLHIISIAPWEQQDIAGLCLSYQKNIQQLSSHSGNRMDFPDMLSNNPLFFINPLVFHALWDVRERFSPKHFYKIVLVSIS